MARPDMHDFDRFKHLLDDAIEIIDSADSPEVNRVAILSAMKLDKLLLAEKRASESLSLLIDLSTTPAIIQEMANVSSQNINTIDKLLVFNNSAYFRIMKAISEEVN